MRKALKTSITGFFLILFVGYALPAGSQEYVSYCNDRYGFCVDYPSHFKMQSPPANNDGRRFYDGLGFTMTVSGINNVLDATLQSEMDSQSKDFDNLTYRVKGKNWYILSGYKDSSILYVKTYIGEGAINHLYLRYPEQQKAKYSRMVEKISGSLKPGDLKENH